MESSAYITLKDVVFSRGGRRIFDGVTLDIPKGKITAIMGPSGTGKTSTARILAKAVSSMTASLRFDGELNVCSPSAPLPYNTRTLIFAIMNVNFAIMNITFCNHER